MPICTFLTTFRLEPTGNSLKVTVFPAGGTQVSFAHIVRQAFPGVQVFEVSTGGLLQPKETFSIEKPDGQFAAQLQSFLELLRKHITIDDELDESHALAPHAIPNEDEGWDRTQIGELGYKAKDYEGRQASRNSEATGEICERVIAFMNGHPRYRRADVKVPAPSSNPTRKRTLPFAVASTVAQPGYLGQRLVTAKRLTRIPPLKEYEENEAEVSRSELQSGTVMIPERLDSHAVVVLDDLYNSGSNLACAP